jgi:hypothetical protein
MHSGRELHELEKLIPDDGLLAPPPLVESFRDLLDAKIAEGENERWHTAAEQAALFKEIRTDEAAGKREDAHWYAMEAFKNVLGRKAEIPITEKEKDKGIKDTSR